MKLTDHFLGKKFKDINKFFLQIRIYNFLKSLSQCQVNWFVDTPQYIQDKNLSLTLYPLTHSNKMQIIEKIGVLLKSSRAIGLHFEGHILSAVRAGDHHPFEFISGFESPVWIALIITIVLFPLLFALRDRSWSEYLNYFQYLIRLVPSETIRESPKDSFKRILLSFWLLSCTIFLSSYAGVLRGFFVRSLPNELIDSWEQLFDRKELRIATKMEISFISHFAQTHINDSQMAQDFSSRIEGVLINDEDILAEYYDKTSNYQYVLSAQNFELEEFLITIGETYKRDYKKVYISKYGGAISPYFIPLFGSISTTLERDINEV